MASIHVHSLQVKDEGMKSKALVQLPDQILPYFKAIGVYGVLTLIKEDLLLGAVEIVGILHCGSTDEPDAIHRNHCRVKSAWFNSPLYVGERSLLLLSRFRLNF